MMRKTEKETTKRKKNITIIYNADMKQIYIRRKLLKKKE